MIAPKVLGNSDAPKTILVLEDHSAVMKIMRLMLKEYSIIETTSAEEALRLFIDHDQQIDLLVADVTLPTSSGIEVALLLRTKLRHLPVILTSGYPVSGLSGRKSADLKRLGSNSVAIIQKPFQAEELSGAVRELIGIAPSEVKNHVTEDGPKTERAAT
jgi:CheY-like chemotaxis protein